MTLGLLAQLGGECFRCVWHILVFSAHGQSLGVCEYSMTACKGLEQSSVCIKMSKAVNAELVGKIRAQACWELHQLLSVMRAHRMFLVTAPFQQRVIRQGKHWPW